MVTVKEFAIHLWVTPLQNIQNVVWFALVIAGVEFPAFVTSRVNACVCVYVDPYGCGNTGLLAVKVRG